MKAWLTPAVSLGKFLWAGGTGERVRQVLTVPPSPSHCAAATPREKRQTHRGDLNQSATQTNQPDISNIPLAQIKTISDTQEK